MKLYVVPKVDILKYDVSDIITTSGLIGPEPGENEGDIDVT